MKKLVSETINRITRKQVMFDDWTEEVDADGERFLWVSVCDECLKKHERVLRKACVDDDFGSGICSVCGCENDSDHYVDFYHNNEEIKIDNVIERVEDLAELWGTTPEHLSRAIYKGTECGAWCDWDGACFNIGSIVEGSDAEFSRTFFWGCLESEVNNWIEDLEQLCNEAWHEANDDDNVMEEDEEIDRYIRDF